MSGREPAVVAVDVGTSAVRSGLFGLSGRLLRSVRVARTSGAGDLFDADELLADVATSLRELAVEPRPRALCVSAHIGTVAVDARLEPVLPGGGWSDTRGLDLLHRAPEESRTALLTAARRPALTGGAVALALALAESGAGERVRSLLSPKDFLVARLTGHTAWDTVDAAYTLASDVGDRTWQREVLRSLGIPENWFAPQVEPTAVVGELRRDGAHRTGLPEGTPVVCGGPDGSVGIGLLLGDDPSGIADVAGTTDVMARLVHDPARAPHGAVVNPAVVPGRWTAGGATGMTGGAVARWRSLVGAADEESLRAVPPGSRDLFVFPGLSGERFPRWRPATRGSITGQSLEHGPAEILRAAQEGASFTVREGADVLDPDRELPLLFAGGSARSAQVAQLRADVLGRVVHVASDPDVTLLGSAALALVGIGEVRDLDGARERLGLTFGEVTPDARRALRYDEVFARWTAARESCSGAV
ncbi:FGGY-family carbohydrate kinase [Nocardiopsis sp. L17-MgMaSL7]|uniref:xylulokinase n=1 Tax=Nocardiopsis sp. L17-MgMaSL7 TaxID=1938893 RepID=UPI000D71A2BB|nr:FGGY-family carbohydrate kinase [Nocardiopsis sp. L17-MgMaSL7]PWV57622.1 gluconokinase/erythritol kinase [Nocardiopsis sp. L17-MgMaSL7]